MAACQTKGGAGIHADHYDRRRFSLPGADIMPYEYKVLDFRVPELADLKGKLRWQWAWFAPQFHGLEHVDASRPALYVGNHTLYGGLDGPLMLSGLYEKTGVYLRSLGDRLHFQVPGWRRMLVKYGTVEGTRENCAQLMESGQHVLVYPGGGREVMKNRGEAYRLIWKDRTGFAAMAMQHGYDIVPFGAVGAEDAYDIRYDADDFRASGLGRWLTRRGLMEKYLRNGDVFTPLVTGVGGLPLPRPQKLYFGFGERISTREWQDRYQDKDAQWQVRRQVEAAVYAQMDRMFVERAKDTELGWWRRRLQKR